MTIYSEAEMDFLQTATGGSRERYLYDDNARPIIDELVDRGLMRAASGEFGPVRDVEPVEVFGKLLPTQKMISLYMLTPYGRTEFLQQCEATP